MKYKYLRGCVIIILGILLVLSLLGIDQLGTATEGIIGWILAIGVLILGVQTLIKN